MFETGSFVIREEAGWKDFMPKWSQVHGGTTLQVPDVINRDSGLLQDLARHASGCTRIGATCEASEATVQFVEGRSS